MGKDVNAMHFSCFPQSLLSMISFNFRELAGWDFTPSVGLVVAGGWTATTLQSRDMAQNVSGNFYTTILASGHSWSHLVTQKHMLRHLVTQGKHISAYCWSLLATPCHILKDKDG